MGETVRIVRIDRPEETFTIGQLVRETRDKIYITNPDTGADEWYDKSAFKILPVTQDYRINLEELGRIRKSCIISARNFQEFIDYERFRGNRIKDLARFGLPFLEGVIPAGNLKGKRIISIACSVPSKKEFSEGSRAICHTIYLKDNQDCGDTRGEAEELLPEKYRWLGEP